MTTIVPDEGIDWIRDKMLGDGSTSSEEPVAIAVGDGTAGVSSTDTQLDNELYRNTNSSSVVDISAQSGLGEIDATISISGGTEVPANSDIRELAIFAGDPNDFPSDDTEDSKDVLLYREQRNAVTIESGDTVTFEISYDITEA